MKLAVVCPVINCVELTSAAYDSIQSKDGFRFILIDQDSNDGTEQWAIQHASENFVYIKNSPKIALAAAWNQGALKAFEDPDCQYVAIVNNDVLFHPKTFDHLRAFMQKTGYLMVTADNIKDRMSAEVMKTMELPNEFTDYDCWPIEGWRAEGPDFSCFMVDRQFFKTVGMFDENYQGAYCEDQDTHVRINRAYRHAKEHNDQGIDPEMIHAKRLSTAPYYHYASQTTARNIAVRHDIAVQHGKNQAYYVSKWGAEHPEAMDGHGHMQPFGDARRNWKWWEGVEKYENIVI